MSETVQITIVTENERRERQEINVTHDPNMTLMTTLLQKKLISGSFCGGRGTCQRCRVRFLQAAPFPTSQDRQAFTPEELRLGYRLACMARPKNACAVQVDFIMPQKIEIVTAGSNMTDASKENDRFGRGKEAGNRYIIAVDLGTTTIAMQLMNVDSGQVADTYCAMNPQRSYGADVLSRIQAANAETADTGAAKIMRDSVWEVLRDGINKFRRNCRAENAGASLCCMCIAGNTPMEHLLMGLSTEGMGKSPFIPTKLGLQKCDLADMEIGITDSLPVCIAPGISAFVGGDIVAGLYTLKMLPLSENDDMSKSVCREATLFIDLGTNGEMAITDGRRMIVTATAAGPAFEGGPGKAAVGSDMVAVTASLLKEGIIDETGLMAEPYFEEGIAVSLSGLSIRLTQKDIRDLQMAKAAVRAGVEILLRKMGYPSITQVYLAGGFGYYLNVDAAIAIGLLPEALKPCTKAVGNTSLAGAFQMGKDLWTGTLQEEALSAMMRGIESINLAEQEEFEEMYIRYMNFQ